MANKSIIKIGKALLGADSPKTKPKAQKPKLRVKNIYKTRDSLASMSDAEKMACEVFASFYGNVKGAVQIKEESLPLTTYANCLHSFCEILQTDPAPVQRVAALWNQLSVASTPRTHKSECSQYQSFSYAPNSEYEKVLIFAGLMVVVKLSFADEEKADEIIKAIRNVAHAKDYEAYFMEYDKVIHTFMPNEVSVPLCDIIDYIKSSAKPYKALALYEMLCNQFAHNEAALSFIKSESESIKMEEPEFGAHIENVHVNEGGAMNMIEGSTVQTGVPLLSENDTLKQLGHED